MSADSPLARDVAERQIAMFAMFVGPGLRTTRAALAEASRIPASSLKDYATGAAMPLHVALQLSRVLPGEAINMLTEPAGKRLVAIELAETNWDSLACTAAALVGEVCDARKDGTIDHVEGARLKARTRALIAEAQTAVETG